MTEHRTTRKEREDRSNRILLAALGGLLVLTVVVVAIATLRPASYADTQAKTVAQSVPAPAPVKPAVKAEPTRTPIPAPAPNPTVEPAAAASVAEAPKTLPEKMSKLPSGTKQIVIITGAKIGSNSGKLSVYNKEGGRWVEALGEVTANFGKNGLIDGKKRQTGNLETPTGIWTIGDFLFGLHASAPSGTKMHYKPIKNSSYWSGERNSTYNTWVDHKVNGEHLIDADPQYEYAFNTGYNSPPNERVFGRGTAIFIHCFEPPGNSLGKYTHGCIAISPDNMVRLFRILDPAKNPTCAIGTLKEGSATSIWAY